MKKNNEDQECCGLKRLRNAVEDLKDIIHGKEKECWPRRLLPGTDYLLIGSNIEPFSFGKLDQAWGGFHTLCADVGDIPGHPLSGYAAGDVLPMSVWNSYHRPGTLDRKGFVYDPVSDLWVQIYLPCDLGGIVNASYDDFVTFAYKIGWRLLTSDEFSTAAAGSNEMTNIVGSERPNVSGGHLDQLGRRMISNIGCEDCCGVMWQFLSTPHPLSPDFLLIAGAAWDYGARCGSRSRFAYSGRAVTVSIISARFGAEPLHKRVAKV